MYWKSSRFGFDRVATFAASTIQTATKQKIKTKCQNLRIECCCANLTVCDSYVWRSIDLSIYKLLCCRFFFAWNGFCIVVNKVTCKTCVFVVLTVCKAHREIERERGRMIEKKADFNKYNMFVLNHFVLMSDIKAFTLLVLDETLFSLRGASKWKWCIFDCFFSFFFVYLVLNKC